MRVTDHRLRVGSELFVRDWCPPRESGAPPLVLMHDSLGCVELWRDFPEALALATGRRVVAYDRAGFGRSDARSGPLPLTFIPDEARVLPDVLVQLRIDRFAILGHSVGGGMAVNIAARHASACTAVVTIAAQAFVEERTLEGLRVARGFFGRPEQMARLRRYHDDKAPWVLSAWLDTWLSPAFAGWSLDPVLPDVKAPLLALHGELDEYGSAAHPRRIAALAGGPATAEILPGVGHVPQRERPDEVVRRVAEFLAGADTRAPA